MSADSTNQTQLAPLRDVFHACLQWREMVNLFKCNNNTIFSERAIFTFPTGRAHWPGSGQALVIHAKVERWRHC